ncbi:MAG: hypothetical protein CMJ19_22950 [Phycisphaeraceae bacterium]|nr:hypothetical protein [Phycisphaeraceae bacterium]
MTNTMTTPVTTYKLEDGTFDEMLDVRGQMRPHWSRFITGLQQLDVPTINTRWQNAQRLIQDNGVTYNVYGDPRGMERPWVLDPIPLVIGQDEWAKLEKALIQRATVLNHVLTDLYGQRKLIRENVLPADLIYGNPHYLRPCNAIRPRNDQHLVLYGVDLARNPSGQWWVVDDRTQAPSGAGYALENRVVMSRTFPGLFRQCGVQRLAMFFSKLRETLARLAPPGRDNPRIVLLTPGPYNETYFEHAYLARYLGLTLVEGGDLAVRDNKVYLKTLSGLQRVDVILRRTDDEYCDPLELRADSQLGISGLVQAAAAGEVTIANALGSGVIETPSFMPFFRPLCRKITGEEAMLPSLATWWCGHVKERQYVLKHLNQLVIKPAFQGHHARPIFGETLSKDETDDLREKILAKPHHYIGQESVTLSTAPIWQDGQLVPRHLMLRVYVAATGDGGYTVMPGGLSRISSAQDSKIVSMQQGGGSKDAWVLSDGPVNPFSMLNSDVHNVKLARQTQDLPSRVADTMFWLGRYVERAESLVRLSRAMMYRMVEQAEEISCPELPHLFLLMGRKTYVTPKGGPIDSPLQDFDRSMAYLQSVIFDEEMDFGLLSICHHIRRLGAVVRDRISLDTWRLLSQIYRRLSDASKSIDMSELLGLLDELLVPFTAFAGFSHESMTQGQGWRFLMMGRRLERAVFTATLLDELVVPQAEHELPLLDAALEIASSNMTYRSRYQTTVAAMPVLDLLLFDETNPQSVGFQFTQLSQHIDTLPHEPIDGQRSSEQRHILMLLSALRLADVQQISKRDNLGRREELSTLLNRLISELPVLSDQLTQRYLVHAQPVQSLSLASQNPASLGMEAV